MWKYKDHPNVTSYFHDLSSLHKVTLETKNEASFAKIKELLQSENLLFHEWIEEPEHISTALCTIPYRKVDVGTVFKKCQLYAG